MPPIEEAPGGDWRDLQRRVAAILNESGLLAETAKRLAVARGIVEIDVYASDPTTTPPSVYFCECKRWESHVPQGQVQAFRTVMSDGGANFGLFISAAGFQSGAFEVAAHTNVHLVDWAGFQRMFVDRWFREYMAPNLHEDGDALYEYTEPINSRIARKTSALPAEGQRRVWVLQDLHRAATMALLMLWYKPFEDSPPRPPALPLRASLTNPGLAIPSEILDATALRPLMDAVIGYYRRTTAEFDEIFGGRA